MQCANLLKKRSLETEVEPWRPKRLCLEAELRSAECPMETSHTLTLSNQQQEQQTLAEVAAGEDSCHRDPRLTEVATDRSAWEKTMSSEYREKLNVGFTTRASLNRLLEAGDITPQEVSVVRSRPPLLCCPRCLGGEPGHINHIMGH